MHHPSRRAFCRSLTALGAACATGPMSLRTFASEPPVADAEAKGNALPMVEIPSLDRNLPRFGFGAFPISRLRDKDERSAIVAHAISRGARYLDTAPSYGNGRSERAIGAALRATDIARDAFFLATKTLRRDADGARRELEASLERLGTDYVDSVQVHEVHDDVDTLFAPNSVLGALEKARDEGLLRHIGITGHRNPAYLKTAIERFPFACALVPVNPIDTKHLSFVRDFLPFAGEHDVAVIAMKVYGGGFLLARDTFTARELLHYALSQNHVDIVVPGCEALWHVDAAFEAVRDFTPQSAETQAELEDRAGPHHGKATEWYKEDVPDDHDDSSHHGGQTDEESDGG